MSAEDAEGRGEHLYTFLSTEGTESHGEHLFVRGGRGGARRTPLHLFVHGGHGESRRTPFFVRGGRGGARRTPLYLFVHGGHGESRRTPFFVRGGRGGARRTPLHLFVHGGHGESRRTPFCPRRTRRGAENTFTPFCPRRARRVTENTFFCPRRTRRGAENTFTPFCPRRARRVTENTFFCPRRTRRGAENGLTASLDPRSHAKGREEHLFVRGGRAGHQWCIGFSLRDYASLRRTAAVCTRKSLFRQTSTSPGDPTLIRNLGWGMDRTVVAQFSCHQPSFLGAMPDQPYTAGTVQAFSAMSLDGGRHTVGQGQRCEEGAAVGEACFWRGRCGGAAPAQGRPLAADRTELQWSVRNACARPRQGRESVVADTLRIFQGSEAGRYESTR